MPDDPDLEKSIKKDQENASSDLGEKEESSDTQDQKDKLSNAQKSQKKAGQKMQQMGHSVLISWVARKWRTIFYNNSYESGMLDKLKFDIGI